MNFKDDVIERIDLNNENEVYKMIVKYFCGENYYKNLSDPDRALLSKLLNKMKSEGLNHEQFNELLLLFDQDRVSKVFYKFFFENKKIKFVDLKKGVIKFRGFAMLCLGNFRYAFKELIHRSEKELEGKLKPYYESTEKILKELNDRPSKALEIEKIRKDQTWCIGYISKRKYEKEAAFLNKLLKEKNMNSYSFSKEELILLADKYREIGDTIENVEQRSLRNTDIYLTWNYMDVYIATSMRHKWEYEETFDFVDEVFNHKPLKDLHIRYFDPTQSQCEDRIDKGLIEGLMLKRSICTIYMAQEVDTLGKDSELAATLVQRKPVIAYVPKIDIEKYTDKIKNYPLDFFRLRFLILQAEGVLDDEDCKNRLEEVDPNFKDTISIFLDELYKYRSSQPFSLWDEKEIEFKEKPSHFNKICRLLAIAEYHSYEGRASTLKDTHPLSIQVDLESGVANGVLVVRSLKKCANLLRKILTNSMNFSIKHSKREKNKGVWKLEEEISKCPFRVVTDYEKLTNSFWNFYLISE